MEVPLVTICETLESRPMATCSGRPLVIGTEILEPNDMGLGGFLACGIDNTIEFPDFLGSNLRNTGVDS